MNVGRMLALCGVTALGGCYEGVSVDAGWVGVDPDAPGTGADPDGSGDPDADPDPDAPELSCADGAIRVGTTPLRRLTRAEYNATVADLLGDGSEPASGFVPDEKPGGFPSNNTAADALQIEQYQAAAASLAATAAQTQFESWIVCDREDEGCARTFIGDFGKRAFRRPLAPQEVADYAELYRELRDEAGGTAALQHVVETMLMSPNFLYHVELGEPDDDGPIVRLTPWEVAGRLSYFAWGTMPDAALMDAAAAGQLGTKDGVEAQLRRLLEDPRAEESVVRFSEYWLDLTHLEEAERDTGMFPEWEASMLDAMQREARAFVAQTWLHGEGTLRALFTSREGYLDDARLAELYGVALPDDPETPVVFEDDQRAGILTLGAVLVSHAYPTENSWVHRGKLVRTKMLCGELPPPPPTVEFDEVNDPNRLTNPDCAPCHIQMDPIGQAFDAYDPTGRYLGAPVAGEVSASMIGTFDSIPQLAEKMAEDQAVQECLADQLSRFALARSLDEDCSRDEILQTFADSGYDLRELMVAIATSDAFVMLNKEAQG
jgi:hypothetical protein